MKKQATEVTIEGRPLTLVNLDKVFWKEEGYTKGDLITYYHEMSPTILPYLKDRPMVMRRNPNGADAPSFFQKDTSDLHLPKWVDTLTIEHEDHPVRYLIVQNEATLLYVINLGCVELNPFNSRVKRIDNPDYIVWDLDPEAIAFEHVIEAAQLVHHVLNDIGIKSYCKTTGGRGLHIYVPLEPKYSYEQAQQFAAVIALMVHQELPNTTSLERMPKNRQGKIYIDTLQNVFSKTLVAPYSVRPRLHATVSTPLKWSEVKRGLDPTAFTIETVPQRVKKKGDLFQEILHGPKVNLKSALSKLESAT